MSAPYQACTSPLPCVAQMPKRSQHYLCSAAGVGEPQSGALGHRRHAARCGRDGEGAVLQLSHASHYATADAAIHAVHAWAKAGGWDAAGGPARLLQPRPTTHTLPADVFLRLFCCRWTCRSCTAMCPAARATASAPWPATTAATTRPSSACRSCTTAGSCERRNLHCWPGLHSVAR